MKIRKYIVFMLIFFAGIYLNSQIKNNGDISETRGPGTYEILHGADNPIRIPFKMHHGKPLMELEVNGQKATLMIDNGILWDQVWLFGSQLASRLQLKPVEESFIGGAGEGDPTQAYTSHHLTLKFKDVVFYDQPVLVSPAEAGFATMFPGADGQLSNTFFRHFIVEFDFVNNEILLYDPVQFQYDQKGSILDMQASESGTYSIPFTFTMLDGKTYTDKVDIDFGGIYPFKIALNNKHHIPLPPNVEERFSYGAQGMVPEYSGEIQSMTIGKYKFDHPTVMFGDEKTSRIHPDNLGVIGLPFFMKFNVIFDYFNDRLYLEPNKNFEPSFEN